MPIDPAVFDTDLIRRGGFDASWLDRQPQTDPLEYLDGDHVDDRLMWQLGRDVDEILARAGLFQGVEPGAVSALTKQLHPVDFPRGHTLFAEGEPGDRLYIVVSGKVKIGRRSPDGRESLLSIMGASDMVGELSIFDPGPRTSSATTITEVCAVSMDRETLRAWIADRPRNRRATASGTGAPATAHQQQSVRPDLHRCPGPRRQAVAAPRAEVWQAGRRRAAGHPRHDPGGDRSACHHQTLGATTIAGPAGIGSL